VSNVAREIIINTAHHFNWVNLGGAITHPDKGKKLDLSDDTNNVSGIEDASVMLYPTDGYGNPDIIRSLLKDEKPDAIMLITDPRMFEWLFAMENEIRKQCPIIYLNIWDDLPSPIYNKSFYESCDLLMAISKQTKFINELVLEEKSKNKIITYIPHGINNEMFKPLPNEEIIQARKKILGDKEIDFVLFFNSRNIRRKQLPDAMLAWKYFIDSLPKEKVDKCKFIIHTDTIVSENGTDLEAIRKAFFMDSMGSIYFSTSKLSPQDLNILYNIADAQILLSSNEGWGLSLTEAILAGTPIIANVTGGMQDQMGFIDDSGKWYEPTPDVPSNHTGRFKNHGEWAFPIFPTNRSLQGSPKTPYIWDDRCNPEDVVNVLHTLYDMSREERKELGLKGREWAMSSEVGFTSKQMAGRVITDVDKLFSIWRPREKFEVINTNSIEKNTIKHKLLY